MKYEDSDKPLMHLFMHIGKLLNDRLRSSLGGGGIHFGQARILVSLMRHGNLIQRTIGQELHIKPATVTNMVKRMEASGLIERGRDANNDRIINVTLTSKGKEAANFAINVMEQIENDIRSEFTQKEIDKLRNPLERIRNTLGGSDPGI
ncbi:putative MarR family protein [Desulforapulum autotrophicum HRM2]|uniref:MarR family protein n=1 Tax=Desulforapulum autotrophicum (strain ATCC 43914 / DSM 3382 / VKM B-1955 / HRM2) TaxID=177437 RepID=C0Q9N1_DESAH|nr:MarR family transcriptional regulator [Desulforapulum autotrophicum]ACN14595.1 putative MarR family protein [Desulforapulum autotrophicum HRM2]